MTKSVEQLLGFAKGDRAVRTYAYLTVAFNTRKDVTDLFDCLLPFVSAVIKNNGTQPISFDQVKAGLNDFGLKIPVYAIEQLLTRLAHRGVLVWNKIARAYVLCADKEILLSGVQPLPLSDTFDRLETALSEFAINLGLTKPPKSESWSDALIDFLRSEKANDFIKASEIKNAIVGDSSEVENFVIARFVQESRDHDDAAFESITQVFTGVLIEDFISNVQEIGVKLSYKGLKIFYDTSVLLRILGTSGDLLQTANLEMHQALQILGCDTHYFESNASEVQNILDTLEGQYRRGKEIYGETSDAIHNGEITIGGIRDLTVTFHERLAQLNIFPFEYDYSSRKIEDHFQIDEGSFSTALVSAAMRNERGYSAANAANDAHVVALTLRLRRGRIAREVGRSRYLFVSRNALLQRVSRAFVVEHTEEYDESSIMPVFTVGQATTVAWLATTNKLEPNKVGRELLANCYNAVQPSEAWADEFAQVLDKFRTENPEFLAARANAAVFLKSARMTARDESLNNAIVLKKLNVVEMFRRAEEDEAKMARETERDRIELIAELEGVKAQAISEVEERARVDLEARIKSTSEETERSTRDQFVGDARNRIRGVSEQISYIVVVMIRVILGVAFVIVISTDGMGIWAPGTLPAYALQLILGLLNIASFVEMLGVKMLSRWIDWLREKIGGYLYRVLARRFLDEEI